MKEPLYKDTDQPREAPEPLTAEERTSRKGMKTAGGGIAAGGIGLAKAGFLGKFLIYLFLWNGVRTAWLLGGWIAIALVGAAIVAYIVYRNREQQA
jgi:hypothetical protein